MDKTLRVGRAKSSNGRGRTIPINDDVASILAVHRAGFVEEFGKPSESVSFPVG